LEKYEKEATAQARPKKGIKDFLLFLKERRIKRALVTNNARINVEYLLRKFKLDFDFVLSRETGLWKPSGAPFLFVLQALHIAKEECCVIGDSLFDIKAAREAGIPHVFILNKDRQEFFAGQAEIFRTVSSMKKRIEKLI
jgi:phosphoglycolate phosphatase